MIRKVFVLVVITGLFASLYASGGSVYSRYGAGDIYHLYSARKISMGTPLIASPGFNDVDNINPAVWSGMKITRLQAGLIYSGVNLDDGNNKAFYSDYDFSGFLFGFPVERELGIGIVAGLIPYSKVGYEIIDDSDPDYSYSYEGSGGLSKIFFGGSYEAPFGINLGFAFEYYTGKIDYSTSLEFVQNYEYENALFVNKSSYYGSGLKFGVLSPNLSEYIGKNTFTDFRIGGFYSKLNAINSDTTLTINSSIGASQVEKGLIESKFPDSYGFGLSMVFDEAYLVALDMVMEPWSKYEVNGVTDANMQDVARYSIGFEYSKPDAQFSSFWEQVAWRCGLSYEKLKYTINGENLDQLSAHAGFSVPLSVANSLDFGFSYSMRGTNSSNLIKEDLYNFAVTLNFGELWFVRQDR